MNYESYLDIDGFQDIKNNILFQYLNPVDIINLYGCSTTNGYQMFEKCLIFQINERLRNIFRENYNTFKKELNDNNLVISGSFILQCIFGEIWISDLDMITSIPDDKISLENSEEFPYLKYLIFLSSNTRDYLNDLTNLSCSNYNIHDNLVQLIKFNSNTIRGYITSDEIEESFDDISKDDFVNAICSLMLKNFDFNVCMNIFYRENGVDKVKVTHLDNIIKKIIDLKNINVYTKVDRIKKYLNRGFIFSHSIKLNLDEIATDYNRIFIVNDPTDGITRKDNFVEYYNIEDMGIYLIISRFPIKDELLHWKLYKRYRTHENPQVTQFIYKYFQT